MTKYRTVVEGILKGWVCLHRMMKPKVLRLAYSFIVIKPLKGTTSFNWSPLVGDSLLLQSATGVTLVWFCCHLIPRWRYGEISDLSRYLLKTPTGHPRLPSPLHHCMFWKIRIQVSELNYINLARWCILFSLWIHLKKWKSSSWCSGSQSVEWSIECLCINI